MGSFVRNYPLPPSPTKRKVNLFLAISESLMHVVLSALYKTEKKSYWQLISHADLTNSDDPRQPIKRLNQSIFPISASEISD